jgi:lipid-A-disaccharide synthase
LVAEIRRLLDDRAVADAQVAGFGEIRALMEQGTPGAPRVDPAERVMRYVTEGVAPLSVATNSLRS